MKLISSYYINQLNQLHDNRKSFGTFGGRTTLKDIQPWIDKYQPRTFLDYGCGKGVLVKLLQEEYGHCIGYDPGYSEFRKSPSEPAEMLICTDVLEHIEPEYIDNVLKHINTLFTKVAYLYIATSAAAKLLPDGRNAHLIVEEDTWWRPKLLQNIDARIVDQKFVFSKWLSQKEQVYKPANKYVVVMEKR